jgi:leader peptidase (prepilin peptidase)/N-methyltransferase
MTAKILNTTGWRIIDMLYISPFFTAYFLIKAAVLGSALGSFICCFAYRYINNESVLKGRSKCDKCGHVLGIIDLIPIIGYIVLRGKCRYCKEKISPASFLSEIILAVAFMLLVLRFNISEELLRALIFTCLLMAIALIDLESFIIPDKLIISGIIIWIATLPLMPDPLKNAGYGIIGGLSVAFGLFTLSIIFDKIKGQETLGGGDIKLFFVTGLYLGPMQNLLNLIIACIVGIFFTFVFGNSIHKKAMGNTENYEKSGKFSKPVPFGPSIAFATLVTMLAGKYIISWYLGLFY